MKSGNLNFLEPSGPLQACNGADLPFLHWKILLKYMFKKYDVFLERIYLAHGEGKWRAVPVNKLITVLISRAAGKLLYSCASSYFPRRALLNGFIIIIC